MRNSNLQQLESLLLERIIRELKSAHIEPQKAQLILSDFVSEAEMQIQNNKPALVTFFKKYPEYKDLELMIQEQSHSQEKLKKLHEELQEVMKSKS